MVIRFNERLVDFWAIPLCCFNSEQNRPEPIKPITIIDPFTLRNFNNIIMDLKVDKISKLDLLLKKYLKINFFFLFRTKIPF